MRTSLQRPSNGSSSSMNDNDKFIPHQGSLSRVDDGDRAYVIEILVKLHNHDADDAASSNSGGVSYHHELAYTRRDFMFSQRLFQILDTESRGFVDREIVKEFVLLRCPVFWRRDEDLKNFIGLKEEQNRSNSKICTHSLSTSPTFDEIWTSVAACSSNGSIRHNITSVTTLGVEGWMVFCRFVALAQYLEAKRRFSARHLQQTMRQRNAPRGSELVMVNVPPMEQPAELSPVQLANHEKRSKAALPLPELDLDHVLVAAHDALRSRPLGTRLGSVKICLFGSSSAGASTFSSAPTASAIESLEFAVTYTKHLGQVSSSLVSSQLEEVVARRSMQDLQWLHATFDSHKVLGGTLCGRILPRFHTEESSSSTSQALVHFQRDLEDSRFSVRSTGGAISAVATASVGKLRDAALSFRSYMSTGYAANNNGLDDARSSGKLATSTRRHTKAFGMVRSCLPESYYNPNSPEGRMRHLERYLNYLLEHPALSTSFPLNTILRSSQSGLEAAKEMLVLCDKSRHEMNDQAPHLEDGQASNSSSNSGMVTNFAWVRTAAQAAMALHVHGMLETTGLSSASARLQHASLPLLSRVGNWDEEERRNISVVSVTESRGEEKRVDFEEGVISVMSELQSDPCSVTAEDDYDLLPLPLPAPERRILSEGSDLGVASVNSRESRFHYGNRSPSASFQREGDDGEYRSGVLSDMAVDDNIDKLREVIGSVDNTLSRCLASCGSIGKADRDRQYLHLDVVRSLDSFAGMRGKFVSQRSLMKGVAGIEQSGALYEEAYISMIDGRLLLLS
ncbi:hypothetical protein MPSEU_000654000 [Mayamaea pseudoterrestris]|nr:hypothetical protein MPSEU_000654000 [Mayamaea pseudoterrestris]